MKIILKKEVANLGEAGDVVEVKSGYGRNYLIPLKQLEETKRQRAHKEAKLIADAEALAAKIEATPVKVAVKVSESGKIYGSVTTAQIEEALKAAGVEVDKKNITLGEIKTVGEYEGTVKCYKAVKATVKVTVEAEA